LGFVLEDAVTGESGEVFRSFANEVDSLFALSLDEFNGVEMHEVLNSKVRLSVENIVPVGLSFSLKVCPPEFIGSLRGSDWNEAVGLNSQYLGRDSILPTAITYTRSLVK